MSRASCARSAAAPGALGLAGGATRLSGEPAELLGDGGLLPVGGPAPLPQLLDEGRALPAPGGRRLLRLGQLLAAHRELLQLGGGLVDGRLHLQQAGRAGRAAVREVGAEQVALGGDGGEAGPGVDEFLGVLEGADDDDAVQELSHGRHEVVGAADEALRRKGCERFGEGGSGGSGGCGGVVAGRAVPRAPGGCLACGVGRACHQEGGSAGVQFAEETDGVGRRGRGGDREGVRRRAEGGRERYLVAGRHRQQFRGRSEQPGEAVPRAEQRAGAVLAAQAERQGLVACLGRGAFPLHGGDGLAGGGEDGLCLGEPALGFLVPLGELRVARVEAVDLRPEGLVLLLGGHGALPRLVAGGGEAFDLGLGGGCAGAGGAHLSLEPGEPFAPVGDGTGDVLEPPFLLGQIALQFGAVGDGVLQRAFGRFEGGLQFGLLLADAGGLALHVLGVPAAPLLGGCGGGALHARVGERDGAAHPFGELGELVPGLLGVLEPRGEAAYLVLQEALALEGLLQLGLGGLLALFEGGLVGDLGLERLAQRDEVVGEEAQAGVAQVGLDDGGATGDGGLAAERLELAAELVGEVLDACEVGLHRVQLAQRLLLALAVFEDAGRLLDEGAAAHGVGVQDGVELALADDDVHLAANAGVGEQFLDVQETAGVAVDLVLAAAVAEHDPRDGDLGVLDGEGPVGVVDGQGHLGAAQGRAAGGAGEDDVLHLAAAQRLGALLAHDPAEGVHHVGLARAVRADDAGDPRFEPQGGRGGERLEAAEGQGLEVHAVGLYPAGMSHSMSARFRG
ncbi:hypothetical protein RKD35_005033 [Streptomyces albogriseolus]